MADTDRRARRRDGKRLLSREAVVEAALLMLREGGASALTMRGVAGRLETGPSSLYAWVRGLRELQLLVIDALAARVAPPGDGESPAERITGLLIRYGRELFDHPGAARVALECQPTGPIYLDLLEECLALAVSDGFAVGRAARVIDALVLLVTATAAEQDARASVGADGSVTDLYQAAIAGDAQRWPYLTLGSAELGSLDGEQRLVDMLLRLLDAFRQ